MEKNFGNLLYINIKPDNKQKRKRNFGIDLARIIAMYFLINHHVIFHGGPISGTKVLSFENNLLLFLNIILSSGVNIFGMISGFVGFHSHKFSNLIYLLLQTLFYNYGIAFFFLKTKPNIVKDIKYFIYPTFISCY